MGIGIVMEEEGGGGGEEDNESDSCDCSKKKSASELLSSFGESGFRDNSPRHRLAKKTRWRKSTRCNEREHTWRKKRQT